MCALAARAVGKHGRDEVDLDHGESPAPCPACRPRTPTPSANTSQVLELGLEKYEQWLKLEGDKFQSILKDKIVRELMTLGEEAGGGW